MVLDIRAHHLHSVNGSVKNDFQTKNMKVVKTMLKGVFTGHLLIKKITKV